MKVLDLFGDSLLDAIYPYGEDDADRCDINLAIAAVYTVATDLRM